MSGDSGDSQKPDLDARHIEAFKKRRAAQNLAGALYLICLCVLFGLAVSLGQAGDSLYNYAYWVMGVFLGSTLAMAIFSMVTWRCPACEKSLAGPTVRIDSVFTPEPLTCPHCGTRLQ
jgi:hypothetical protein